MGAPNLEQQIQYPIQKTAESHGSDKFHALMDAIGNTIGWGWVFGFFILGAFIGSLIVFKRQVKKVLGDFLKFASDMVNK